jgi:hypothetical protein
MATQDRMVRKGLRVSVRAYMLHVHSTSKYIGRYGIISKINSVNANSVCKIQMRLGRSMLWHANVLAQDKYS